jgi:outer membrane immunogenic protein
MRSIISAAGSAIALLAAALQPAAAADMPVKAPLLPPAVMTWTGGYVGINGGYSWSHWNTSSLAPVFPLGTGLGTTASPKLNGGVFGAQAGYNWQTGRQWVLGLEGDVQWTGERARTSGTTATARLAEPGDDFNDIFSTNANSTWKLPWFATFRARAGGLIDPGTLLYVTGGLALGNAKFALSSSVSCQRFGPGSTGTIPAPGPCFPPPGAPVAGTFSVTGDTTQAGLALGGGIEKKFTPNWSGKIEYLYLDFGSTTFTGSTGFDTRVHLRDNIIRAGINYSFGGPGTARY